MPSTIQIAGIFEFLGAMVLGGETTKTVASDISNLSLFKDVPEIYMYGMLCSVAVAGTWLLLATYWCLPVSTTHSISESIALSTQAVVIMQVSIRGHVLAS